MASTSSEDQKIREWQKDVIRSIGDDVSTSTRNLFPAPSGLPPPRAETRLEARPVVVNQIVTNPPVVVTRVKAPEPKPSDEISTKAIIGTVVGATAGAFIAYAMVKGDSESSPSPKAQETITYRTIEAPIEYRPGTRIPIQDANSTHRSLANGNSTIRTIGPPPARAETLVSKSGRSLNSGGPRGQSYKVVSRDGPIVMVDNEQISKSRASSTRYTVKQQNPINANPSAPVTEVRLARDVPLPTRSQNSRYSQATSATTIQGQAKAPPRENPAPPPLPLPSLAPSDSISQVSTRKSTGSGHSKHHHSSSHHGGRSGKSDHRKSEKEYEVRKASSKAGSKHKMGEMVDDVVNIIKGTSMKESEHRR